MELSSLSPQFREPRMDRMLTTFPTFIAENAKRTRSDHGGENSIKDLPDAFNAP